MMGWYDAAVLRALTRRRRLRPRVRDARAGARGAWASRSPRALRSPTIAAIRAGRRIRAFRCCASTAPAGPRSRRSSRWPRIRRCCGPTTRVSPPTIPARPARSSRRSRGGVALFVAGPLGDQKPRVALPPGPDAAAQQRRRASWASVWARWWSRRPSSPRRPRTRRSHSPRSAYRPPPIDVRGACAGWVFAPLFHVAARQHNRRARACSRRRGFGGLRLLASPYELGVEVAARIRQPRRRAADAGRARERLARLSARARRLRRPAATRAAWPSTATEAALPFADAAVRVAGDAPRSAIRADLLQLAPSRSRAARAARTRPAAPRTRPR